MAGRLEGKVAIVLGASRRDNMGQAIAARFIAEGAKLVAAGRTAGQESELAAFAARHGCEAMACDVTRKADLRALAGFARERFGRLDIAVNAAATGQSAPFLETTEREIDEMNAIIVKGGIFFYQAMIEAMPEGGALLVISSAVADIMFANHAPYMGAKAALNQITRAVANEFGAQGIRANIVSPGFTVTPMSAKMLRPGTIEAFAREYPLGRITTIDDIANAALFAVSDECFMTGETFHVTGGLRLRRNPTLPEIAASVAAAAGSSAD
ncbi:MULTISPECIES: SDR family oxidoreductase [unclassified Sphingobium]|uniref:SDR family oxidoreductase n=1 Tax=unclassified Sphingobium TaxID=2611147 RepID=UPI000D1626BA|nr:MULTISPECIES: SDR family oxidoreductase [unclassified Sphingobium]MBG6120139.1 NAD(P)-dependent dehydrogenase (short-subunit alcohol dehydrogenase family) [Sphingobium sp. JAI105]PSO12824.1 oxidoreductase [Sphingobium sp. AEW4]TWD05660.1 NAD(P)-dependent dehydrogenase (short-subunit alcohol dehydrogenase family) [Sphingobium sp. AEW010]TWD23213.1 NAD(P)-dependent dehydrogenase (short-subunit alcohol dehydrogenase family) [Sphingobium sp. AEW013]TWD25073.1 NAD(P)-dependent dehydrogenase (sho